MTDHPWFQDDLRRRAADAIRSRRDTLAADLQGLVGEVPADPFAADLRARLIARVVDLLAVALTTGNFSDNRLVAEIAGLQEAGASLADLLTAVRLGERCLIDDLSGDEELGTGSEQWPAVLEVVRGASFEVLATLCRAGALASLPAATDPLTTLMSRGVFEIAVTKELQRAVRYHHAVALILFEADDLAAINHAHGHAVADLVLERLGVFMQRYFRQPDWVARCGVDSIGVLLPETRAEDAVRLAEGAMRAVQERLIFSDRDERKVAVTVSAAVVTVTLKDESNDEHAAIDTVRVMAEAEAAVKRARARGANTIERVEVARDSVSVEEAAGYLDCSPATVRKLVGSGTLHAVKTGSHLRIDRAALEAYALRQRRLPKPPTSPRRPSRRHRSR